MADVSATTDDVIRVRRATSSDYRDVIDINDDILDGCDYLPTIYDDIMQSPTRYAVYIADTDKKLVALAIFGLDYPDGDAYLMGLRVRPGYEGRGFIRLLRKQFLVEHPNITHFVYNVLVTSAIENKMKKCSLLWQANMISCHVDGSKLATWLQSTDIGKQSSETSSVVWPINDDDECQELVSSGKCQRLLSHYAVDQVPAAGAAWEHAGINNRRQLADRLSKLWVTVTYDECQPNSSNGELASLCYSGHFELKTRSKAGHIGSHIYFYGDTIDCLVDHFLRHLHHMAKDIYRRQSSHDLHPDIYMELLFPLLFDRRLVASLMTSRLRQATSDSSDERDDLLQIDYDSTAYFVREIAS